MFRLLDLFCGAGGAGMGYHRAGFEVVGVDKEPQKNYPFEFHQADALEYLAEHGREFDVIHASPPCQEYVQFNKGLLQAQGKSKGHYPMLIESTRQALVKTVLPYVIENVIGAPLIDTIQLCGSSFGLLVQRHRLFESNVFLMSVSCAHKLWKFDKPPLHSMNGHRKATRSRVYGVYGNGRSRGETVAAWSRAMGIDWMTRVELSQAIPPAYTEFIGRQLLTNLEANHDRKLGYTFEESHD